MVLKPYNELPVSVRRSKKEMYEYLRKEIQGDSSAEEESPFVTPVTRSVSFSVNDGTNSVAGANVVINGDNDNAKTTGNAGGCTASLDDGEHLISVSAEGYVTKTETITVSESNTSFTISLEAAQ